MHTNLIFHFFIRSPTYITSLYFCHIQTVYFAFHQGTNKERNFSEWSVKQFQSEIQAREFLKKNGIEHYWDIALSQSLQEETEEGAI